MCTLNPKPLTLECAGSVDLCSPWAGAGPRPTESGPRWTRSGRKWSRRRP